MVDDVLFTEVGEFIMKIFGNMLGIEGFCSSGCICEL